MSKIHEQILRLLNARYACKKYNPERKISDEDFKLILEAGRLAPSSFGFEPWRFLVIKNPEIWELLRQQAWGAKEKMDCSHFVIILARLKSTLNPDSGYLNNLMARVQHLPQEAINKRLDRFAHFVKEDIKIDPDERAYYDWACRQTYLALGNMMNVAAMLGIDSTPIEGFNYDEINQQLSDRMVFDPSLFRVSVMCAFGYRADEPKPKTRQPLDQVVQVVV